MIDVNNLSQEQLQALRVMSNFKCGHISCDECPLYMNTPKAFTVCGSLYAKHLVTLDDIRKGVI